MRPAEKKPEVEGRTEAQNPEPASTLQFLFLGKHQKYEQTVPFPFRKHPEMLAFQLRLYNRSRFQNVFLRI